MTEVALCVGVDSRIGRKHLTASVGFGGACYEAHLRNLVYLCGHYRLHEVATYWESVIKMNEWQVLVDDLALLTPGTAHRPETDRAADPWHSPPPRG